MTAREQIDAQQRPSGWGGAAAFVLGAGAALALLAVIDLTLRGAGESLLLKLPWTLSRAAGIVAYLLLAGSTLLGLSISTRLLDRWASRAVVFALHEYLSWLALAATGLHVVLLLQDSHSGFTPLSLLIPGLAPYAPLAMALGTVSLYLAVAITVSFRLRARIGQRAWRLLHYSAFALFALATAHGVMAGSSTGASAMQWLYLVSGGAVLLLTNYRLLR